MALICDHPPRHIPLLIGHDQAPTWLMSSVSMSPGGIWGLYMLGGGKEGTDLVRSWLATLDSLHASGLHLHGHMGTLCRDAPEGMRGTGLEAVLKPKTQVYWSGEGELGSSPDL